MKLLVSIALAVAATGTAATAQQYNDASASLFAEPPTTGSSSGSYLYDFGPDRRPEAVMRSVRDHCATDGRFAQRACSRAKRVLDGAFAEYRVRAAAGTLRSQR